MKSLRLSLLLSASLLPAPALAASHYLVLSGGDQPAGNHLSQYLQTKTLTDGLRALRGEDAVDVRFAAGNNPQSSVTLADVYGAHNNVIEMRPGVIDGNAAATKANVVAYFDSAPVRALTPQDTFFLLVSDHGMGNRDDQSHDNNCIDLWRYHQGKDEGYDLGDWSEQCFSKDELLGLIKTKVRAQKAVFAMSQCFSGGFHKMSVTFKGPYPTADVNVCGFTAITEDSVASGCTSDVDGPGYKGYERFLTQQITGRDVVTGAPLAEGARATLREAHFAAALEDMTVDIPTATSDFYLTQWGRKIESTKFAPRTGALSTQQAKDLYASAASLTSSDPNLSAAAGALGSVVTERLSFMRQMTDALARAQPSLADLIERGSEADLKKQMALIDNQNTYAGEQVSNLQDKYQSTVLNYVLDKWELAVTNGTVTVASDAVKDLEVNMFQPNIRRYGNEFVLGQLLVNSLAITAAKNPALASAEANYYAQREKLRSDWAIHSSDKELQMAGQQLVDLSGQMSALYEKMSVLSEQKSYVRRVLLMRQQLAAAVTLGAMGDEQAIAELGGLLRCEMTAY